MPFLIIFREHMCFCVLHLYLVPAQFWAIIPDCSHTNGVNKQVLWFNTFKGKCLVFSGQISHVYGRNWRKYLALLSKQGHAKGYPKRQTTGEKSKITRVCDSDTVRALLGSSWYPKYPIFKGQGMVEQWVMKPISQFLYDRVTRQHTTNKKNKNAPEFFDYYLNFRPENSPNWNKK